MQYLHSSVIKVRASAQVPLEKLPGFAAGHRRWTVAECETFGGIRLDAADKEKPACHSKPVLRPGANVVRLAGFPCYASVPRILVVRFGARLAAELVLVEPRRLELLTSALQRRRSPS